MAFRHLLSQKDLRGGEKKCVAIGGKRVLLVNIDQEIRAYEDLCPHRGGRLSDSVSTGVTLTCPLHHWTFDARTGAGINPSAAALKTYAVRLEDDAILVDIEVSETIAAAPPASEGWSPLAPPHRPEETAPVVARPEDVGPVLTASAESRAVVQAIREANGDVRTLDRASYTRVLSPSRCRLPIEAVEKYLGRPFRLPSDLEKIMSSFRGKLSLTETEAVWEHRELNK